MSNHTVTENLVQRNGVTTATVTCSCGKSVEGSLRRKPLRALRVELTRLHEAGREKTDRKVLLDNRGAVTKPKEQPVVETEPANDTEPEQDLDEDWPDEDTDKS